MVLLIFSTGLAGCAKEQPAPAPALTYAELMATVRHTTDSALAENMNYAYSWGYAGDSIWGYGQYIGETDDDNKPYVFATANTEGGDVAAVELTMPEKAFEAGEQQYAGGSVQDVTVAGDGTVYALVFDRVFSTQPDGSWSLDDTNRILQSQLCICGVDAQGQLARIAVLQPPPAAENDPLHYFFYGALGMLYAADDGTFWIALEKMQLEETGYNTSIGYYLCRYAADGTLLQHFESETPFAAFIPLADGSALVTAQRRGTREQPNHRFVLENDAGEVTIEANDYTTYLLTDLTGQQPALTRQEYTIPWEQTYSVLHTDPQDDRLLFEEDSHGICQFDTATGQITLLLRWENYGIAGDTVVFTLATGPDTFLVVTQAEFYQDYKFHNIRLGGDELLAGQQVVTLGVLGDMSEELKQAVDAYNYTEPAVYVKTVDYTDAEALEKDIINRTAPDILLLASGMNGAGYIRKGMFLDLYPYLDADPQLSREALLPNVLAASEFDGTLPTLVLGYNILTTAGDPDVVGADTGWTWAEYDALTAAYPDAAPIYRWNRSIILHYLLQLGGGKFINYADSMANLDSPDFVRLLTASAAYPAEILADVSSTKEDFAARRALLELQNLAGFREILSTEYTFDGPVVYKGFPSDTGTGNAIQPALRLGINATCADPDAAWAFLRTLLLPDFQENLQRALPVNSQALADMAADALQPAERGISYPSYLAGPLTPDQQAYFSQGLTQAQVDQVLAAIKAANVLYEYDFAVFDIIQEEADYFYNGVRTAEEAAAIMQNRVQTYLDEQG